MRANFVWVEPQSSESNVGSPKPKVVHQEGAGDRLFRSPPALEINTNWRVQVSVVVAQVKKTMGACHHRTVQEQTGEFHGN